jgi:steroid delta-isomerase-like uncharacterized protein
MADDAVGGGGDDSRHRRPTYTQEAPDVSRQRGAGRPQAPPAEGPEGVKARIAVYQNALEGYWDVQEIHSAGDRVVVRWIGRGTHTGELMGVPATGATVAVDAITILRIADGQIAEEWTVWDALGLLQQVGAVPAPA